MLAEAVDMKEAVKEEMERRYPNCRIQLAERTTDCYFMVFLYMFREASWHRPSILMDTFRMATA